MDALTKLVNLYRLETGGAHRRNQEMTEASRERRLRKIAQKQGLLLRKSRGRLSMDNQGGYMIVDPDTNVVVAGERFDLDLDAAEAWLAEA